MKTALIVGYTGVTGQLLLKLLCESFSYQKVICLGRSKPKMEDPKIDFQTCQLSEFKNFNYDLAIDDIFCCLGTTQKIAGSKEAFYAVDCQAVLDLASLAERVNCKSFHVMSSYGANAQSGIYYNKVKGEMEEGVAQFKVNSTSIYQPSVLDAERKEFRFGEWLGVKILKVFSILPFKFAKLYKPVRPIQVAKTMLRKAENPGEGFQRVDNIVISQN